MAMETTGFYGLLCLFCGFLSTQIPSVLGKPLSADPPYQVWELVGKDVILPCGSHVAHLRGVLVEWLRLNGSSEVTLIVMRDGKELEKEKAPGYSGRMAIREDGSLTLRGVQQQDNGTYKCVVKGSSVPKELIVSLTVVQGSEVNFLVGRTSANQLFVLCESSGWNPEPQVSLLDSRRTEVPDAKMEVSVRPDGLFVVKKHLGEAIFTGNRSFICRVEVPENDIAHENKIFITGSMVTFSDCSPDEFDPPQTRPSHDFLLFVVILALFVILAAVLFFCPLWMIEKLRLLGRRLTVYLSTRFEQVEAHGGLQRFTEYGDIHNVETTGASEVTAQANGLQSRGAKASEELAERDNTEMSKYKKDIFAVGNTLDIHPALIAAIISRQSQAGTKLNDSGYGLSDPNCYGLMQINRHYHAVKSGAYSLEHIDQGVTFLIQLIKTMQRTKRDWSKERQLKGALACYIAGEDRVIPLTYEELDSVTPNGDFSNDVVARAKWFCNNDFKC